MKLNLRTSSLCGLCLSFVSCTSSDLALKGTPPPRPNIVLILVDDMGFSDLGSFGSEIRTPHLDRLATQGMRLTDMQNTAKCFPSRACLMTGVYAQQNGMAQPPPGQFQNAVTFGHVLGQAGYTTLFSGKHHGTENPYFLGFDRYAGLRDGASNHFNPGLQREGEPVPAQKNPGRRVFCFDEKTVQPYTPPDDFYTTDAFTDWALEWLDDVEKGPAEKPFFLYLSYTAPHDPLMAWPEDIAKYEGVYDGGYEPIRQARYQRQVAMGLIDSATAPLSPSEYPDWESLEPDFKQDEIRRMMVYAAMVDRVDQNIGRLLDKLASIDRLENTLILFISDNGASSEEVEIGDGPIGSIDRWTSQRGPWANVSNTPFRLFKNFSHEGGTRSPMIAWWPGHIQPGSFSAFTSHFIDFMPTFVELSGAEYLGQVDGEVIFPMQGVSLWPALKGDPAPREGPLFFQWGRGRAVRLDQWKIVSKGGQQPQWELYDMETDQTELTDLSSEFPERTAQMAGMWEDWYENTPAGKSR